MATPGRWIAKTVRDKNISVRMKRCGADELETQPVDTKEKAKENDSGASSSGTDCDSLRSLVTASERDDDKGDGDESDASADGGDDDGGESSLGSFVDGDEGILAHLDEQNEALQARNINVSTSPSDTEDTPASDAGSCPSSPPEQQQQQQHQPSARDRAEAAARDAFAGTGCVMRADIDMSDIEEEQDDDGRDNGDDASDGSLFEFGDAIDGEEAIRAFLDGELDDATPPEEQQAVGKRATEAVARSASEGTGWVSGVDSVLSGGDSDDYKDNDEDFINSIGYVEEVDDINVVPDNEGAARLHEDDDNALAAAGAGSILASRDGTMGSRTSSLPEEQQSAREQAEAAARDAFAGTGCVVGADIGMSDIEEEEDGGGDDASDGSLFDFGDVIDGEEAIRAFLDGELDDATPPEEQQQQQAIGKSAAEAAARSALDSTGWVSNDDVVLSNGDGDDDEEDNNEDFMNSTDHVEEVPRSDNGNDDTDAHDGLINSKDFPEEEIEAARDDGDAAQRDEDTDTTLAANATPTTTALACSFGSTSSPSPPEEKPAPSPRPLSKTWRDFGEARKTPPLGEVRPPRLEAKLCVHPVQMSSREEVQAAARMASSDTKCVVVSGGAVSDVDEDDVTEAEVDAAIERLSEEEAAKIMQEIMAADGWRFPHPFVKAIGKRKAEAAARSAFAGNSCGFGSEFVSSDYDCGGDGEGDEASVTGTIGFVERGPFDNNLPAAPPALRSPPLSPPPPPRLRLDFSGDGDYFVESQRLNRFAEVPRTGVMHRNTQSSPPSPSTPPPPPPVVQQPVVQQPPVPTPQPGIPEALSTSASSTHVSPGRHGAPSPPPPLMAVRRLTMPPSPAQALPAQLRPPSPSTPAFQARRSTTPSPSSFNPLAGMFSPELDALSLASSLGGVLYRGGILPVSAKSRQILKAAGRGQATSAMMEAIIRGMQSSHGKKNLARENDGAKFVGPKTRTPTYKTGKGVSRLLGEVSKRHNVGAKFVVCLDSPSPNSRAHVITGVILEVETPPLTETEVSSAWGFPLPLSSTEAFIHGEGGDITIDQWVRVSGGIGEDGQRLSAWVY